MTFSGIIGAPLVQVSFNGIFKTFQQILNVDEVAELIMAPSSKSRERQRQLYRDKETERENELEIKTETEASGRDRKKESFNLIAII